MRLRLKEVLVVEGRYDKNTLSQVVDATIIETRGFGIFRDPERAALLRLYADTRGIIVLTDSDGAGFLIRNRIRSIVPNGTVKHAYIPDLPGKERRKSSPSKEGKLGVEGMPPEVLRSALLRAGATLEEDGEGEPTGPHLKKADFYALGLSGGNNSREKRKLLAKRLGLPERISADALLEAVNTLLASGSIGMEIFDAYRSDDPDEQDAR